VNHTTKTANVKKALLLSSTSPFSQYVIFKMAAAAILSFQKFEILTIGSL